MSRDKRLNRTQERLPRVDPSLILQPLCTSSASRLSPAWNWQTNHRCAPTGTMKEPEGRREKSDDEAHDRDT
jgi:hypothetical protein